MDKQAKYDTFFMDIAERCSAMSVATRLKVGAVITKNNRLISSGFNGSPPGLPNECEEVRESGEVVTKPTTIHAEENAIIFLARSSGASTEGSTLYSTHSPCFTCARLAINAGISRVVYRDHYRDGLGVDLLKNSGVSVTKIGDSND